MFFVIFYLSVTYGFGIDLVYEVEAQKENTHNLPKRSRLYQGIIDSKLLPPGVVDFNLLNEVLIVLIMPFDLFGYELYRYTFQMRCEEVPELKLDDGATRIFLNTKGKHPELVSQELIELLKYMERSTDEVSRECKSKRIQEMHRRVCQIKASEKAEVKYMHHLHIHADALILSYIIHQTNLHFASSLIHLS